MRRRSSRDVKVWWFILLVLFWYDNNGVSTRNIGMIVNGQRFKFNFNGGGFHYRSSRGGGYQQQQQQRYQRAQQFQKKNYYSILGLTSSASEQDVRKAFKTLARKYHPDRNDAPEAKNKFVEINEAHSVLSDKALRREYDAERRIHTQSNHRHQNHQYHGHQQWHYRKPRRRESTNHPFMHSFAYFFINILIWTSLLIFAWSLLGYQDGDDENSEEEEQVDKSPASSLKSRLAKLKFRATDIVEPPKPYVVIVCIRRSGKDIMSNIQNEMTVEVVSRAFRTDPVIIRVLSCNIEDAESRNTYDAFLGRFLPECHQDNMLQRAKKTTVGSPYEVELDGIVVVYPKRKTVAAFALTEGDNLVTSLESFIGRLLEGQIKMYSYV